MKGPRGNLYLRPVRVLCELREIKRRRVDAPIAQRDFTATPRPNTIDPGSIPTYDKENKAFLVFVVFYLRMETRDALERAQVNINLGILGGRGSVCGNATPADSDVESLQVVREVREDKTVVCADLLRGVVVVVVGVVDDHIGVIEGIMRICDGSGHGEQARAGGGVEERAELRARLI